MITITQCIRGALPLLLLAGCAATPGTQTASVADPGCERTYRMGSNIPVTSCASQDSDADRQRSVDDARNQSRPMLPAGARSGG